MKKDKKLSLPVMAIKNLKAKKFRTAFMMFFVILMSATVFFSTLMMNNLELGIKNTTERMGANIIVVPKEGTENIRESLFSGEPCSIFFDRAWEDAVRGIEGVTAVSPQLYVATLSTSCCDAAVQIIAYDPETDFVVKPWLKDQTGFELEKGEVVVGSKVQAQAGEQIKLYDTMFNVESQMEKTGMGYDSSVFMTFETLYELKNSGPAAAVLPLDEMENMVSMLMVDIEDSINSDLTARARLKIKIEGAI